MLQLSTLYIPQVFVMQAVLICVLESLQEMVRVEQLQLDAT